jgi:plastocyanin
MKNASAGFLALLTAGLVATGCGGGGYGGGASTPTTVTSNPSQAAPADVVITISGMSFSPAQAAVGAGQTVSWKNADGVAHTATQDGGSGFDTGSIAPGATSAPIAMTAAGTLKYHCTFHSTMTGSLVVGGAGSGY